MYAQTGAQQPLIFYADDTQGGNTLAATSTRKSTLIYAAFLNFEFLHLEEMWMTLSVIKASDSETCHGGLAGVITALLSFYQEETAHGIPVQVGANYDLLFVPHVVFLSDHEGVRAAMGCKGAAGFKPCIKCRNCVSLGRATALASHADISCVEKERFLEQRHEDVQDILRVLRTECTRKRREEAEVLLGFKLNILQQSPLAAPQLQSFFRLEWLQFDAMHHLFSNGLIAQELGLWFQAAHAMAGVTAEHMQRYMRIGWQPVKGGQSTAPRPDLNFGCKLWKTDADFRGDAQACLHALPLCVSYGEDMLRERFVALHPVLDSLVALHRVVSCVKACKANRTAAERLLPLQRQHMEAFISAHTTDVCRPKIHYQLHLKEQMDLWGKAIDCFVCERKHKQYKSICGSKLTCSQASFARSALSELCSQELATSLSAAKLGTFFATKALPSCVLKVALRAKNDVQAAAAIEHRTIRYGKGLFMLLSNRVAVEVLSTLHDGSGFFLLVETLQPIGDHKNPGRTQWMRKDPGESSRALLAEKYDKLMEDHEQARETVAAIARHLTYLRERLKLYEPVHAAPSGVRAALGPAGGALPGPSASAAAPPQPNAAAEEEKRKMQEEMHKMREKIKDLSAEKMLHARETAQMNKQLIEARAPATVYYTRGGNCYHADSCNHLKHGREDHELSLGNVKTAFHSSVASPQKVTGVKFSMSHVVPHSSRCFAFATTDRRAPLSISNRVKACLLTMLGHFVQRCVFFQ
eukprot:s59_g73.t1